MGNCSHDLHYRYAISPTCANVIFCTDPLMVLGENIHHPVHYGDVIMTPMAFQITSLTIVFLIRRRSTKTSKLRVNGLCEGNSPVTGGFPTLRVSNAENVSIWWRHHVRSLESQALFQWVFRGEIRQCRFIVDCAIHRTSPHCFCLVIYLCKHEILDNWWRHTPFWHVASKRLNVVFGKLLLTLNTILICLRCSLWNCQHHDSKMKFTE